MLKNTNILLVGHFEIQGHELDNHFVLVLSDKEELDETARLFIGGTQIGDAFIEWEVTFEVFRSPIVGTEHPQLVDKLKRGTLRSFGLRGFGLVSDPKRFSSPLYVHTADARLLTVVSHEQGGVYLEPVS